MPETRTTSSTGGQKGVKLARFDLIPAGPLRELAEHYGVGASKYADHQWRQGYEWSKSIAALSRHFNDFMAGKDFDVCSNDPEGCSHVDAEGRPFVAIRKDACFNHTGSHHMAAVAWHAFCLMEFKDSYPEHDDRYKAPEPEKVGWLTKLFIPHANIEFSEITPGAFTMFATADTEGGHGLIIEDSGETVAVGIDPVTGTSSGIPGGTGTFVEEADEGPQPLPDERRTLASLYSYCLPVRFIAGVDSTTDALQEFHNR